jgi:hypothetical protein
MAKTEIDLRALTDEEFMDKWTTLGQRVEEDRQALRAFSQEHQRRNREAELRNRLRDMTPEDLALIQGMGPVGIESQAEVGSP